MLMIIGYVGNHFIGEEFLGRGLGRQRILLHSQKRSSRSPIPIFIAVLVKKDQAWVLVSNECKITSKSSSTIYCT